MSKIKDVFSFKLMNNVLDSFISYTSSLKKINKHLTNKKIRMPNFPSEISENIVRYVIIKQQNVIPIWDIKPGDLTLYDKHINKIKIEVKGFSSKGPTSFGPNENWDILYFIDCVNYKKKMFRVYEIKLSNKDEQFRNIKLTSKKTFGEIADADQRGKLRGSFKIFEKELGKYCEKIFDGSLDELKPKYVTKI